MGGLKSIIKGPKKPKPDPAVLAAQKRQEVLLKQQEAAVARERQQADDREAELSGQDAALRRAILARRRGRGALAFTAGGGGLKDTLGG